MNEKNYFYIKKFKNLRAMFIKYLRIVKNVSYKIQRENKKKKKAKTKIQDKLWFTRAVFKEYNKT